MSDEEKQLVSMILSWVDGFGPGRVDLELDPRIPEKDLEALFEAAWMVGP